VVTVPPVSPPRTYTPPSTHRSILILSTHLSLGLPSGLFPFCFPTKTLYNPLLHRSIIILPTHLRLGLPSGLLPPGFPTKNQYTPLSPQIYPNIHPSTPRYHQWSLSLTFHHQNPIHPLPHRSILKLSTHLSLGLQSGHFPSSFRTKTLYTPSPHRSIVILSTHLRLGLPSGLFPSSFPTKTLYTHLSPQIHRNIIHPPTRRSPQWTLSLRFPHQDPIHPPLPTDPS